MYKIWVLWLILIYRNPFWKNIFWKCIKGALPTSVGWDLSNFWVVFETGFGIGFGTGFWDRVLGQVLGHFWNNIFELTLNELWTRVSSRSITMHFLSWKLSSGLKSGSNAFWGALEGLAPPLSMTSPVLFALALTSLSLFFCFELLLPRQHMIEHRKLDDRFFAGSEIKLILVKQIADKFSENCSSFKSGQSSAIVEYKLGLKFERWLFFGQLYFGIYRIYLELWLSTKSWMTAFSPDQQIMKLSTTFILYFSELKQKTLRFMLLHFFKYVIQE